MCSWDFLFLFFVVVAKTFLLARTLLSVGDGPIRLGLLGEARPRKRPPRVPRNLRGKEPRPTCAWRKRVVFTGNGACLSPPGQNKKERGGVYIKNDHHTPLSLSSGFDFDQKADHGNSHRRVSLAA